MKPEEIAIAAGALGAALLDTLTSKNVMTQQEASKVTSDRTASRASLASQTLRLS